MSSGKFVVLPALCSLLVSYACATGVENPASGGDDDDGGSGGAGGTGGQGGATSSSGDVTSSTSTSSASSASVAASSSSTGGVLCGNGMCEPGESCQSCPSDCSSCCGNGICDFNESCATCPNDCFANCCPAPPPGDPSGPSIYVFANYDGGSFTISVDANVPNLVIGLVSYIGMTVDIVGPFVGNVTAVHYVGFDDLPGTTVSGVPPAIVTIDQLPPATLVDPSGNASMVCQYQGGCADQGGCNTSAQVIDWFQQTLGGIVISHTCQYDVYMGTLSTNVVTSCP